MAKSYRVSARVGTEFPRELGTYSKKSEATATAKAFMASTPSTDDYDSVQVQPLRDGQRDWSQESIRWVAARKGKWRRGEGIR